jgi:hypothetical protein
MQLYIYRFNFYVHSVLYLLYSFFKTCITKKLVGYDPTIFFSINIYHYINITSIIEGAKNHLTSNNKMMDSNFGQGSKKSVNCEQNDCNRNRGLYQQFGAAGVEVQLD